LLAAGESEPHEPDPPHSSTVRDCSGDVAFDRLEVIHVKQLDLFDHDVTVVLVDAREHVLGRFVVEPELVVEELVGLEVDDWSIEKNDLLFFLVHAARELQAACPG
jgi:hypothetical protein